MRAWPKHPCDPTILLTPSLLLPCPIRTFCSAPSLLLLLLPPPLFSTIYVHRHRHRHRHRYHSFLCFLQREQTRPDQTTTFLQQSIFLGLNVNFLLMGLGQSLGFRSFSAFLRWLVLINWPMFSPFIFFFFFFFFCLLSSSFFFFLTSPSFFVLFCFFVFFFCF